MPHGGSDDVGDIVWAVPTITIFYPSHVPNLINHNPLAAMAMATPIAHKGVIAGAKAVAFTVLDLLTTPQLIRESKAYFNTVQMKDPHYETLLSATANPAMWTTRHIRR